MTRLERMLAKHHIVRIVQIRPEDRRTWLKNATPADHLGVVVGELAGEFVYAPTLNEALRKADMAAKK